jgi:hypothetical protein
VNVPVPTEASLLPARVRRLSNFEYDRSIAALFATPTAFGKAFAPDFRQGDFTQNAAQQVDSTLATQLQSAAQTVAKDSVSKLVAAAGCAPTAGESCASQFIASFGQQAYRRPLTTEEKAGLVNVWKAGSSGATFNDGIALVVEAILQSPNFLYVTELGEGAPKNGVVRLSDHEIASALSFLVTGGPPDKDLIAAAAAKKLGDPAERELQARRLLKDAGAKLQLQRLVKEWLGIDRLEGTGKDAKVYPQYEMLRPKMAAESDAFISEVLFNDDGTVTKLLTADYTVADQTLAEFYGMPSAGPNKRSPFPTGEKARRGILMQSAFQSVHGHDHESAPVKRGTTVLKKVLCVYLPTPGELNLKIVPPAPDPNKTTRERFAIHSEDPACAGCHKLIDPFGFAYENLDGIGWMRKEENKKPINTAAEVGGADVTGMVKDGVDLSAKLAASEEVKRCFARNLFRFSAAQSGQGYEEMFFKSVWDKLPAGKKVDIKEMIVALAASDIFVNRRTQ